jgi:hypothetical protein
MTDPYIQAQEVEVRTLMSTSRRSLTGVLVVLRKRGPSEKVLNFLLRKVFSIELRLVPRTAQVSLNHWPLPGQKIETSPWGSKNITLLLRPRDFLQVSRMSKLRIKYFVILVMNTDIFSRRRLWADDRKLPSRWAGLGFSKCCLQYVALVQLSLGASKRIHRASRQSRTPRFRGSRGMAYHRPINV